MNNSDVEKIVRSALSKVGAVRYITLDTALTVCRRVREKAKSMGLSVVVAISDAGGNTVCAESMDGAYVASYDIAVNKAYTCASLKMSTKTLEKLARPNGELYGIQFTNGGRIVIFGGGDPLNVNGETVGGIGVSGGTNEQDTALSAYGVKVWEELTR